MKLVLIKLLNDFSQERISPEEFMRNYQEMKPDLTDEQVVMMVEEFAKIKGEKQKELLEESVGLTIEVDRENVLWEWPSQSYGTLSVGCAGNLYEYLALYHPDGKIQRVEVDFFSSEVREWHYEEASNLSFLKIEREGGHIMMTFSGEYDPERSWVRRY